MDFAPALLNEEKYDAVFLNTPWKKLSQAELEALPIKDLCKDNASLFMWADSFSVADAAMCISKWGLQFKSVAAIMNLAEKPAAASAAPAKPAVDASASASASVPASEEPSKDVSASVEGADASETEGQATSASVSASVPAEGKTSNKPRGPRIKSIQPPSWWLDGECLSRPTTEMLFMAVLGEGATANPKWKSQPYQVCDMPELAKSKARGRQPSPWCPAEWAFRRPSEFLNSVVASLAPGSRIVELFGDSMHDSVHAWGPALPASYVPALSTSEGVIGTAMKALEGEGKVSLRSIAAKLRKMVASPPAADQAAAPEEAVVDEDTTITALLQKASAASGQDWTSDDLKRVMSACADYKLAHHSSRSRKTKRASRGALNADGSERKRCGIAAAGPITPELCAFFGEPAGTQISRTMVVKRVNQYIEQNKLKDGRKINIDDKLKALLDPPEGTTVTFFNMCRLLSKHFIKKDKSDASVDDASASAETVTASDLESEAKKQKIDG